MAVLLEDVAKLCLADLADSGEATWSQEEVEQGLVDAISDYALHFQR